MVHINVLIINPIFNKTYYSVFYEDLMKYSKDLENKDFISCI